MTSRFVLTRLMVFGIVLCLSAGASMAACLSGDALTNAKQDTDEDIINRANQTFVELYNKIQAPADPWTVVAAQYTDDATFAGTLQPYWLEGRPEIEDLWMRFFTAWPNRNIEFRHRRLCTYTDSAVETGFIEMYMGAEGKDTVITYIRYSRTWVKSAPSTWQIANMNVGRMPGN